MHKEAVAQTCSVKKMFLEILQNSQENTCAKVFFIKKEALAQLLSCEFCEISKNTFFYRTPLVVASLHTYNLISRLLGVKYTIHLNGFSQMEM